MSTVNRKHILHFSQCKFFCKGSCFLSHLETVKHIVGSAKNNI